MLGRDERSRAERFVRAEDRRRYIVSHGVLRRLLGERLGIGPSEVGFETLPRGKPFVPNSHWHFSLSHSGDLMAVALARSLQLGVDVEQMRPMDDYNLIAERYFAGDERRQLQALPDAQRQEGFFAYGR